MSRPVDVVVIGSGPNGLAAAIVCAAAGRRVVVYEAASSPGGAARTAALTLPGFLHDHCASIFPLARASPFFRSLPIDAFGVAWAHPAVPLAHPLDDGRAVIVERSVRRTAERLRVDAEPYRRTFSRFVHHWEALVDDVLAPPHWPKHPRLLARFGRLGVLSSSRLAGRFRTAEARALVAGLAAHSGQPLESPPTAAFALLLGILAHAVGWPVARGGAQAIVDSLTACLRANGGEIVTDNPVDVIDPPDTGSLVLCDVAPEHLARLGESFWPRAFRERLRRFVRGPGVFKIDWALDGPIPWQAESCAAAATVHVGGTLEEIARWERSVHEGRPDGPPFVIVAQPSVCDPTRAPAGRHVAWGYCHVPTGSPLDFTDAIERAIERFAPRFRERILARHVMRPYDLMRTNPNLVGGDITGGANTLRQLVARPWWRGYDTPHRGIYLCSAASPPGGGVHGMCGYWAARRALSRSGA